MMLGSAAERLLFTCVFATAALGAALPIARHAGLAMRAGALFCIAMCAALIAMSWWAEPARAVWLQVAVFSGAAVWLVLIGPVRVGLQHAMMAAAMTWMLTAMPASGQIRGMAGTPSMASMVGAPSVPVLAVSGLDAACCVATSIPRVTGGLRFSEAAMSVGMAAMVIAML